MTEDIQITSDATKKKIAEQKKIDADASNRRERYRHRAFTLMIKIALILGIPAFSGLYFGKKIDAAQNSGNFYTFILLGIAFVLSWSIIIIIYVRFNREVKRVDAEIKKIKEDSSRASS